MNLIYNESVGENCPLAIGSPTWPFVLAFAEKMEAKLAKNRHKGDREAWIKDDIIALRRRIHDELRELDEACNKPSSSEDIVSEAVDVANFCMMVADWYTHHAQALSSIAYFNSTAYTKSP